MGCGFERVHGLETTETQRRAKNLFDARLCASVVSNVSYTSIFASIVIFALSNFEIGHPALALSAAI